MTTAVHLSIKNAKTKVDAWTNNAYPCEGVPTLNVAGEVEALKPLCSSLQSHKVQEVKMADFWPLS